MSGEFDVVTSELTAAAGKIRTAVSPVSCYTLSSGEASAAAFGHNELAEVFVRFCTKASQVVSSAASGDEQAAGQLDASAASYDATDDGSGARMSGLGPTAAPSSVGGPR